MKLIEYIKTLMLSTAIASLATSCEHKALCIEHPHTTRLRLAYDWSEAPEAQPRGMTAFFYSEVSDGTYQRFNFQGSEGGEIELAPGRYVLVTYNNDSEVVQFGRSDYFDLHHAYTRTGDILEPIYGNGVITSVRGDDDERVTITPDRLYGITALEIEVEADRVSYVHGPGQAIRSRSDDSMAGRTIVSEGDDKVITVRPHDMLCHYSYEVRHVRNADGISSISAGLSSMAPSINLSTEVLDQEPVTLPLPGVVDRKGERVTGEFMTFGHEEQSESRHRMSFYVVLIDGSKYRITQGDFLDVTEQIHTAPNPRRVHLIIDTLDIPKSATTDDGFTPSLDNWSDIYEDLEI